MADAEIQRIRFALNRAVERLFSSALRGRAEIEAEELRAFVRNEIETQCHRSPACQKYWKHLTNKQKTEALRIAVPDGVYPKQVGEDLLENQ